jgi:hypothetical protein
MRNPFSTDPDHYQWRTRIVDGWIFKRRRTFSLYPSDEDPRYMVYCYPQKAAAYQSPWLSWGNLECWTALLAQPGDGQVSQNARGAESFLASHKPLIELAVDLKLASPEDLVYLDALEARIRTAGLPIESAVWKDFREFEAHWPRTFNELFDLGAIADVYRACGSEEVAAALPEFGDLTIEDGELLLRKIAKRALRKYGSKAIVAHGVPEYEDRHTALRGLILGYPVESTISLLHGWSLRSRQLRAWRDPDELDEPSSTPSSS